MNNHLKTKDVSLTTFSVTIKALHVDSKKMTLAVFKQLPCIDLYDDNGNIFVGFNIWGYVKYSIGIAYYWAVLDYEGTLFRGDINLSENHSGSIDYKINKLIKENKISLERIDYIKNTINELTADLNTQNNKPSDSIWHKNNLARLEADIFEYKNELASHNIYLPDLTKEINRYQNIGKSSKEIFELPQLFIAI
jgi:hypothetical protein